MELNPNNMHIAGEMLKYVRSLRNAEKRDYAGRYAIWMLRSDADRETVPEPRSFHLSYMGAQAVRTALYAIEKQVKSVTA